MSKKAKALFLTMSLLLSLGVSSCGQADQENTSQADASGNEEVVIRFMSHEQNKESFHKQIIADFEAKNPGIKVQVEYPALNDSGAYQDKVNTMILGGEKIDLVVNTYMPDYNTKSKDGMYVGLNQFFEKEGTTYDDEYNIDIKIDGEVYGLPWATKTFITYLNMDMLEEAGLDIPDFEWTWDEYQEYAKKLTKGDGAQKVYGSYMQTWTQYFNFGTYSSKMDTPYFNEDGSLYFDESGYMELRWEMEHVDKSQMPLADVISSKVSPESAFFGGQAAMVIQGTWMLPSIQNTEDYPHDFVTGFATVPGNKDDKTVKPRIIETRYLNIPNTSEHQYEAFQFARYYTTEGMNIDTSGFSAAKDGADTKSTLDNMVSNNESGLYDMDSLYDVMMNEKIIPNPWIICPPYISEIETLWSELGTAYMVGDTQDTTQLKEDFFSKGQEIIDRYN